MFRLIDYSEWNIIEESPYGSGRSEKYWIMNPKTSEKGIFKYPKITSFGTITGEYWAEKLASELGKILNLNIAEVEMGTYEGRVGSMSFFIPDEGEILLEAVNFIAVEHPDYDFEKLYDSTKDVYYSLDMIEEAFKGVPEFVNFLETIIFDALIGNSDRHHSNWGLLIKQVSNQKMEHRFSPLYDNGSSLCCYVERIANELLSDQARFNAQTTSKSKTILRTIDGKRLRHHELVAILADEYYNETIEFVERINNQLTEHAIVSLLEEFPDEIINANMKKLITKFIIEKRNQLIEIYGVN